MNLIELKAQMLCEGVNVTKEVEELFQLQNPSKVKRGGLSSGGKLMLSNSVSVNVPFYHKKKTNLKLTLDNDDEMTVIIMDAHNNFIHKAKIIESPKWYTEKVDDFNITQVFTVHGKQLASSVFEDCVLFKLHQQCKFCVINQSLKNKDPRLILKSPKLYLEALNKIPIDQYKGIVLNGGMTLNPGRGIEYIIPVVKAIKAIYPKTKIAVEIAPPKNLIWIEKLKETGIESLMMNLECWDDRVRENIIPGKSPKQQYLNSFDKAVEMFGKGFISSCFIVGIESMTSLKEGIRITTEHGVIPSPLAGRYFEDIPNYPFTPTIDYHDFLEIAYYVKKMIHKNNVVSSDMAGCVACGMCDIIHSL